MTIRVFLVDDHLIFRQMLRERVAQIPNVEVIGESGDGREAVALCAELVPDVVVMDVTVRGLNGVEATRQLVEAVPEVRVLGLSVHTQVPVISAMFQAGARGYLPKSASFQDFAAAIQAVAGGQVFVSPSLRPFLGSYPDATEACAYSLLTPRECEVLQLIAEGRRSREIADLLCVSIKTVESHRHNLMHKLDLYTVAELTRYAIREGLTPL